MLGRPIIWKPQFIKSLRWGVIELRGADGLYDCNVIGDSLQMRQNL